MSLTLTRHDWMDAPVAPHAAVDRMAAAVRPRDLAAAPPKPSDKPALLSRAPTLVFVVAVHAALVAAGALAWRANLSTPDLIEEIPVEIVIESPSVATETPAPLAQSLPAVAPGAAGQQDTASSSVAAETPPVRQEQTKTEAEAASAPQQAASSTTESVAQETPAPARETAKAEAGAEMLRAEEAERETRAAAVARRDAERLAQERAAQARAARERAEERAEVERERRAQARRAAERARQAQAAQERRRIAAHTPATDSTRPAALAAFDAAGYRAVVARAVSASTSRACSAGGGGRVVVALLIAPSGRVASASLSSASGNSALDSAALSAVRRAGPFPAPSNRASVSVPVVVICR